MPPLRIIKEIEKATGLSLELLSRLYLSAF
jgi:hypothetical protein